MNRKLTTIAFALAGSAALAQFAVDYHDKSGDFKALGPGGGAANYIVKTATTKFTLKGSANAKASIASRSQGVTIEAASIAATVVEVAGRSRLQSAQAIGGVEVTKRVASKGAVQTTLIEAPSANYAAGTTEGRITLEGAVTVTNTDPSRKQTSVITGRDGVVTVDPDSAGNDAMRTATLEGRVKVDVLQEPQKEGEKQGRFVATGNRLVYNNVAKPATITLLGNVNIENTSNQSLTMSGVDQAVITLNERNEMTEVSTSGSPTTTTIRKAGGKG